MIEHDLDGIESRPYPDGHGGRIYRAHCICGEASDEDWRWMLVAKVIVIHVEEERVKKQAQEAAEQAERDKGFLNEW